MNFEETLDVTPPSTISTFQLHNEVANTIINSVLIGLTVANINSIISKLVHLTHKNRFRYASFLRVYIFHNSDDLALLFSWLRQAYSGRENPSRSKYRVCKRRLWAPLAARLVIFIATIGSIAISIPSEKSLNGCNQGDVYLDFQRRNFQSSPTEIPERGGPVCTELRMDSNLGSVRSRANYCSVPVYASTALVDASAIVVRYFEETAVLYTGVVVDAGEETFLLQASEAYVEWVDSRNRNYRSRVINWQADAHLAVVLDAIQGVAPGCRRTRERQAENNFTVVEVDCKLDVNMNMLQVADAYVKNSLRWERSRSTVRRLSVDENFKIVSTCPIDISVSRPIVNMVPLFALLTVLFTLNLAVSFTISERGDVLDQTFVLVKEVLGHDCSSGAIERSDEISGVQAAEKKKWVCSGGEAYHEGFLQGEGCDEVNEFPKDAIVSRCKYADGSGRRMVKVPHEDGRPGKTV